MPGAEPSAWRGPRARCTGEEVECGGVRGGWVRGGWVRGACGAAGVAWNLQRGGQV